MGSRGLRSLKSLKGLRGYVPSGALKPFLNFLNLEP
jgi:hypothetical protein